jgi:hypothetical protein
MMQKLYGQGSAGEGFFTTDPQVFKAALQKVECKGNEEMLVALDTALDFPFGPPNTTKRVVAMFTNEKLEEGIEEGKHNDKISAIVDKMMTRKVKFFGSMPEADSTYLLGEANESEIETNNGGENAWDSIDFSQLLAQMGKSISGSSLQASIEPPYQKALFGQDKFAAEGRIVTAGERGETMAQGEIAGLKVSANKLGVILDNSGSMQKYRGPLRSQINSQFANAVITEVCGCGLESNGANGQIIVGMGSDSDSSIDDRDAFHRLIEQEKCDAIYWFADFTDKRSAAAENNLKSMLLHNRSKLFVRAVDISDWVRDELVAETAREKGLPEWEVRQYLDSKISSGEITIKPQVSSLRSIVTATGGEIKEGEY